MDQNSPDPRSRPPLFRRGSSSEHCVLLPSCGVSLLGGIGFTVSLLVAELSLGHGSNYGDQATAGILVASLIASLLAAAVLPPRDRHYRQAKTHRLPMRAGPNADEPSTSTATRMPDPDDSPDPSSIGGQA